MMPSNTPQTKARYAQVCNQAASAIDKIQVMKDASWGNGVGWTRVDVTLHPGAAELWQWIQDAFELAPVSVVSDCTGEATQVSFIQEHAVAALTWMVDAGLIKTELPHGVSVHYPEFSEAV